MTVPPTFFVGGKEDGGDPVGVQGMRNGLRKGAANAWILVRSRPAAGELEMSTCICGRCARVHTCSHCGRRWEPQGYSHCPSCGNPVRPALNGAAEPKPDIRAVEARRTARLVDLSESLNVNFARRIVIP